MCKDLDCFKVTQLIAIQYYSGFLFMRNLRRMGKDVQLLFDIGVNIDNF